MKLKNLVEKFEGEVSKVDKFLLSRCEYGEENTNVFVKGFDREGVVFFEVPQQSIKEYFIKNCEEIPVNSKLFDFGSDYERNYKNRHHGFALDELFINPECQPNSSINYGNYIEVCEEKVARSIKRFDLSSPANTTKDKRALEFVRRVTEFLKDHCDGKVPIYNSGDKVGLPRYKRILEIVFNDGDTFGDRTKIKISPGKGVKSIRVLTLYLMMRDSFRTRRVRIDSRK